MNGRITHGLPSNPPEGCFQTSLRWLALGLGLGMAMLGNPAIAQSPPADPSADPPAAQTERSPQRPTLQLGSQGVAVAQVQAMLTLLGYYTGPVDGQYQDSTAIAVATFQQAAGLAVDGVMGANTWAALLPSPNGQAATEPTEPAETPAASAPFPSPSLETPPSESAAPAAPGEAPAEEAIAPSTADLPVLRLGMRGSAVERLQERLRVLGVYSAPIDGIFGPATQAAVQDIQQRNRLNADGVVGPATWTVLFRAAN